AQKLYRVLHRGDGSGHKRRKAYHLCAHLLSLVDDNARGHVPAHIVHLEAVIFEQSLYDIFAYVVNIALYRGDYYFKILRSAAARKGGLYHFERARGRLGAHKQLGQKERLVFKSLAHFVERGDN